MRCARTGAQKSQITTVAMSLARPTHYAGIRDRHIVEDFQCIGNELAARLRSASYSALYG